MPRPRRRTGNRGSAKAAASANVQATAPTSGEPGCAASASPKRAKYNAQGRRVAGVWIPSEAQAVRYEQLLSMQERGLIEQLHAEVSYPLVVGGVKIATYRADHVYRLVDREKHVDELIVEEVKGLETPDWKLKLKLFEALYAPLRIRVIRRVSGKGWTREDPALVEQMIGRKSSFAEWIKLRYADRIPE